jgi:hypothetical protein
MFSVPWSRHKPDPMENTSYVTGTSILSTLQQPEVDFDCLIQFCTKKSRKFTQID